MGKYWKNFSYIIRHKLAVLQGCFKHGLYWQGLTHDLSKFHPGEFFAYADYFFSGKPFKALDQDPSYELAWLTHQRKNRHHFQWWIIMEDSGNIRVLPMPEKYWKEMCADWVGSEKSWIIKGLGRKEAKDWYGENQHLILLHPETRKKVEEFLGYEKPVFQRRSIFTLGRGDEI